MEDFSGWGSGAAWCRAVVERTRERSDVAAPSSTGALCELGCVGGEYFSGSDNTGADSWRIDLCVCARAGRGVRGLVLGGVSGDCLDVETPRARKAGCEAGGEPGDGV